jgi:hypothetical protein
MAVIPPTRTVTSLKTVAHVIPLDSPILFIIVVTLVIVVAAEDVVAAAMEGHPLVDYRVSILLY